MSRQVDKRMEEAELGAVLICILRFCVFFFFACTGVSRMVSFGVGVCGGLT